MSSAQVFDANHTAYWNANDNNIAINTRYGLRAPRREASKYYRRVIILTIIVITISVLILIFLLQSNFVLGLGSKKSNLYVIDFGLARRYVGPDGEVRPVSL